MPAERGCVTTPRYSPRSKTRTSTSKPMMAAPIARPMSSPLTPTTAGIGMLAGRDMAGAAAATGAAGAGRWAAAAAWAAGAAVGAAAAGGGAAAAAAAAGAGILIVGAAVGFGGRLMRTVSFLGCTLTASAGLGGTAPAGTLGMFSAINLVWLQTRIRATQCQSLILRIVCAASARVPHRVRVTVGRRVGVPFA